MIFSLLQFKLESILRYEFKPYSSRKCWAHFTENSFENQHAHQQDGKSQSCLPLRSRKGNPILLGEERGRKKEGVERVKKFRVIVSLLLSPLISLVGNEAIHSETFFLSASARLGFQSSTMKICPDQGLGVCTYSPGLEME